MSNLEIYCVTNKKLSFLENTTLKLAAVGKDIFSDRYLKCDNKINIYDREKYYSELTFHYWYWKNCLNDSKKDWIGFCQKRRFWIKSEDDKKIINTNNLNQYLLDKIESKLNDYESIICNPIYVSGAKKIKMMKRGWRNLIKDPLILFQKQKQTIAFHFDMHHGHNNLEKAAELLDENDKNQFVSYINNNNFYNPHIMCIARPEILEKWFNTLFPWLEKCEEVFGFNDLKDYDTLRLYAYLAERYLSFWFKKYTKYKEQPWVALNL
jgi:hypothetical protein|tara:strand:+ start:2578 stop:3375 length:798 start_codon:yes stop_codon:yes gene_type:complete